MSSSNEQSNKKRKANVITRDDLDKMAIEELKEIVTIDTELAGKMGAAPKDPVEVLQTINKGAYEIYKEVKTFVETAFPS